MYRKGTFDNKNKVLIPSEISGRLSKTPRLVLNKLNIPLESVVIVKDDTVIIQDESSKNVTSEKQNTIDVTASDDDLSNDVEFQKMVIKRFQSTKDRIDINEKSKSNNASQSLEKVNYNETVDQSSSSVEAKSDKKYYSSGPKSKRKLLSHPIRKKAKAMSTEAERKSPMKISQSGSDECLSAGNDAESTFSEHNTNSKRVSVSEEKTINVDQPKESSAVSTNPSYVFTKKSNKNSSNSKLNIAEDVAEILAMLEDSPVERDENEKHDNISENEQDANATPSEFTPSRTSQRIKNKKVKFSALRLLAGGELPNEKKKSKTNSIKKTSTPKRSAATTDANSTADINANNSDLSPIAGEDSLKIMKEIISNSIKNEDSIEKSKLNKSASHKPSHVKKMLTSKNKVIGNSEKMPLNPTPKKVSLSPPSKEKITSLKEKELHDSSNLKKNNINGSEEVVKKSSLVKENHIETKDVSNKIRVELQGAPQKKIVNITISQPSRDRREDSQVDSVRQKKDIALGPDIIIRKIKSGKKPDNDKTVAPAEEKEKEKTVERNENIQNTNPENSVNLVSDVFQNNLIIKNLIYPEKTTKSGIKPMQEVEVPPQIKKFIEETTKNKKPSENVSDNQSKSTYKNKRKSELNKRKYENKSKQKGRRMQSSDEECSDREDLNDTEDDNDDVQIISSNLEDDDRLTDVDGADKTAKKSTVKSGDSKRHSKEETFNSNVLRVGGKKTAKVQPLRQVTKITLRSATNKFKSINEKDTPVPEEEISIIGGKRNYKNAFEKHFICKEKIYDYDHSIDSDSSSDDEDTLFSHFIDLRRRNRVSREGTDEAGIVEPNEETVNNSENNSEQVNNANTEDDNNVISELGEVIKGIITSDLPKWTCHAIPENSVICLLLLEREANGIYDVRKSIELDNNFNANVYVNKKLINEFCGVYDSYDAIKNLIYQVELL